MFGDLGKMMKLMTDAKTRLPEMKRQLHERTFECTSGGGAVKAIVSGAMAVKAIEISPDAKEQATADELSDMILAAVSTAQAQAAQAAADMMKDITGGVEIPGLTDML